jgi:hypothetical protein
MELDFKITATQDEGAWLEDYILDVIANASPPLPAHDYQLGSTEVHWHEVAPFVAHVAAKGQSPMDELFAVHMLSIELANLGYRRAHMEMTYDHDDMQKTATWDDVYKKAARLVTSGNVTLHTNGPTSISATVQGDHGTYPVEIKRDDPNSSAITSSHCDCDWGNFQNQPRTRQWKQYQDRPCWIEGSLVNMADGRLVPIEEVQPGDQVLSAYGPTEVSHTWKNPYDGEMFEFKWMGSNFGTTVTADHKMIVHATARDIWNSTKDSGDRSRKTAKALIEGEWQKRLASDVRPNDWIKLAYPTEVKSLCIDTLTLFPQFIRRGNRVVQRNHMNDAPLIFESSYALLDIIGYYLAEGSIENAGKVVSWTFAKHEEEYVQRLADSLAILNLGELKRYPDRNRIAVKVSNIVLAALLEYLCGDGAHHKHLAAELMLMPTDQQKYLLERYAEGDGTGNDFTKTFVVNTASEMLAKQLVSLGARIYDAIPAVTWMRNHGGPTNREADGLMIGRVKFNQQFNNGVRRLADGYYATRVTSIAVSDLEGYVYNLTVPPHHTVAVDGVCSYQCAHILATYWKALATPMDQGAMGEAGQYADPFGTQNAQPNQQMSLPGMEPQQAPQGPQPTPDIPADQFGKSQQTLMNGPAVPWEQMQRGNQMQTLLRRQREIKQQQQQAAPPPTPESALPQFPMDPSLQPQHNPISTPGGKPQTPLNPVQYPEGPGGTFSSWRPATVINVLAAQQYQNGDIVELQQPDWGTQVGRSEDHGAGQPFQIPAGQSGEVLGTHPSTGMVNVLYMGEPWDNNGPMEPYGATAWHFPNYLKPRPDLKQPGPAIRRYK